jgi:NAD(P)-dependent dehydrogenase (short-subunit alcohol dehydrogenase family)
MSTFDLTGRVAVVTGGNRGIGLGMARGLAKAGASVAIWSRNEERNAEAVAELTALGPGAAAFACDVADRASVETAMAATAARFGRVHSLFASAGVSAGVRFEDMETAEWEHVIDVNLHGVYHTTQVAARHMIEHGGGGSLVLLASVLAHFGMASAPHYSASKGAVLQLAKSLAARLARYGIRVNTISPGWIATEMTEELRSDERLAGMGLARTPMRRFGTPDDLEGPAVFLASDASAFMTGAELVVDGGYSVV